MYNGDRVHLHVPMSDYGVTRLSLVVSRVIPFFIQSKAAFASDGSTMLVHCSQGVNRSTTAVLIWLIVGERMSLADAWARVKQQRPIVLPHESYLFQLVEVRR